MMNRKKRIKSWAVIVSLIAICTVSLGTLAYLTADSGDVINTSIPGIVENETHEEIDGTTKNNVKIANTGNADAFIRAAVLFTWQDANGNVFEKVPVEGTDYNIKWTLTDWVKGTDGFYYFKNLVEPEKSTDVLFTECTEVKGNAPDGYFLSVEIIGQSVQARGIDSDDKAPVILAWGTENGGSVEKVEDYILTITKANQ